MFSWHFLRVCARGEQGIGQPFSSQMSSNEHTHRQRDVGMTHIKWIGLYASLLRGRPIANREGRKSLASGSAYLAAQELRIAQLVLLCTSSVYTPTKLGALRPDLRASNPGFVCSDIITSVSFRWNYVIEISADNSFSSYHLPKLIFHYIFIVLSFLFFFSFFISSALSPRTIP